MLRAASYRALTYAAIFAVLFSAAARSQSPPPHFEAASIRPGGEIIETRPPLTPGRLVWTTQLSYLVGYAYDLDMGRVSYAGHGLGGIYAINAVYPPNTTNGDLRLMLQTLLADRFNLQSHREVKEVDGFALTIAKGGIKVKESAAVSQPAPGGAGSGASSPPVYGGYVAATLPRTGGTEIKAGEGSFKQLTETLGRIMRTPFWDQTGLQGKYDFDFRFSGEMDAAHPTSLPSLSTALKESLGIVMQKQKGPLETLVIDHLDPPSEN